MHWERKSADQEVSDAGYTVCRTNGADGWRYSAWGTDAAPGVHWSDWPPLRGQVAPEHVARAQGVHYPRGVQVPQRCPLLGVRETAEQARALCERHWVAAGTESGGEVVG